MANLNKAQKVFDELIKLNQSVIIGLELHGGDTPDSQLDWIDAKIDDAIARNDKRMVTMLHILLEHIIEEMVESGWSGQL